MQKRANVLIYFILGILLIILFVLLYMLLDFFPATPQEFDFINAAEHNSSLENASYKVTQFYYNMRFNHNDISYSIEDACPQEKKDNMIEAFSMLHEKVNGIEFYPSSDADIKVTCSKKVEGTTGRNFFVAGEGGAEQIIATGKYNVVTKGTVLLYGDPHGSLKCDWPNVELHELMHVFGFEHSTDERSLMYPYLESCKQELDTSIIEDLNVLYAQANLSDVYFENVQAVKHGRYLDFNATIKNSGLVDAENIKLRAYDNGVPGEEFDIGSIRFGAGVTFTVVNAKLDSRYSESVELVLDPYGSIKELDKANNKIILEFKK